LKLTNDDGVLTYKEMGEALGLDPVEDRGAIVSAVRRAAKEHEEVDKRAITVVPNRGYRIAAPREHLDLARRQQKRSSKALVRGQSKVVNVDMSKLDPEARRAFEVVAQGFAQLMDFNRRFERRQQEHTEVIQSLVETSCKLSRTWHGNARQGNAWQGEARRVMAWPGGAPLGIGMEAMEDGWQLLRFEAWASTRGWAWRGKG